jgi:hypothetical protein
MTSERSLDQTCGRSPHRGDKTTGRLGFANFQIIKSKNNKKSKVLYYEIQSN